MAETYLSPVREVLPRLLSQLDRTKLSPTFGNFDREFWMHKTKDFSSSTYQMSIHALSLLYKEFPEQEFHRSPVVFSWIEGGIQQLLKIQHRDGSFDEWYPNERGWAGPTGYVLHSLCQTYLLLKENFSADFQERIKQRILTAAHFLCRRDEKDILANHYAIALLPLWEAHQITGCPEVLRGYQKFLEGFKGFVSQEGWSLEYDGVDIAYNLATLSFFARLHRLNPDPFFVDCAKNAFEFLKYFFYPDGSFAGHIGSRHTSHLYPFAIEYWSKFIPEASGLVGFCRKHIGSEVNVGLCDQEDHYLPYRLSEYLEAALIAEKEPEDQANGGQLPSQQKEEFKKCFPEAGIFIQKTSRHYIVISLKRGGALKIFDCMSERLIEENAGFQVETTDGQRLTSLCHGKTYQIEFLDGEMTVSGWAEKVNSPVFTLTKMIGFRLTLLAIGWNAYLAYSLKCIIRKVLIVGRRRGELFFSRKLTISSGEVRLKDEWRIESGVKIKRATIGGNFHTRYVPQSRYFSKNDLVSEQAFLSEKQILELNQSKSITLTKSWR